MIKKLLFGIVLLIVCSSTFSQKVDHVSELGKFSNESWSKEKINNSITWYTLRNNKFIDDLQRISVLKIDLKKNRYGVSVVYSDSTRILLSEMAENHNAMAAINGTFFNMKKGGAVVFLKVNNQVVTSPNPESKAFIREAALAVGDSVTISAFPKNNWKKWHTNYEDIMVSGPVLVTRGKLIEPDSVSFNLTKHPRSAIGITNDYEMLFVTADGRHKNRANGLTIKELGILMKALNCKDAMNLDGGGSTTLWLKKKGVINYPSDNKIFDHEGARAIANGIIISKN
ncbi:phosphodiester glycosidase family protein [Draconibacterium halophilum]|uniref:Phosphodiester glycosidase family protein n=1 Tax=Draconibacterium halophilum TaxID=2706887 RepID=A0A6C0RH17_9BACT|nr:phosphodiester glycosidase family protein [Draconibacterium halophilum]QIA09337.1 phosphodiester glycosidase family protein [Draconibacterium halophilum]